MIAATHWALDEEVSRQAFRADLFDRLNVFPIRLPPLRERGADIPTLAEHFMHQESVGGSAVLTVWPTRLAF